MCLECAVIHVLAVLDFENVLRSGKQRAEVMPVLGPSGEGWSFSGHCLM